MLLLKRHLVELVRAGKKRQTVRLWSRAMLRAGQISYTPGLGKMRITGVDRLAGLEALTEADAVADGFRDLQALLGEIRRIYGVGVPAGRSVFRVTFEWPVEERGGKDERRETKDERGEDGGAVSRGGVKSSGRRVVESVAKRKGARMMTAAQRKVLRAFVVEKRVGR